METIKTDILIVGGGIAGCFAAIRASEMGKSVVLLDKSTIRRGGSVGPGMDHVGMGIAPEGLTLEEAKKKALASHKELMDPNVILAVEKEVHPRVVDLEKFGVPVREDDGTYFVWKIPERHHVAISYRGVDTKVKLAEAVRRTKTNVVERTMAVDLLTRGDSVAGVVALNVRDGKITTYLSKATILCTGEAGRQYLEPDGLFMTYHPTTNTGDSEAMAYRAGAKLANMEYIYMDYTILRAGGGIPGIKPYDKMGILVNRNGEKVLKEGDSTQRGFLMVKEIAEGKGPLYWDFRNLPDDVLKMYEREMSHEYPIAKEWFKQRGLDIRKDLIPLQIVPAAIIGGVLIDETMKTSLKGLYAAGSSTAYLMSLVYAAASGHIAAGSAVQYVSELKETAPDERKADEIAKVIMAPLKRVTGTNPIDLEQAARSITTDYVGYFKSEGLMQQGLKTLLELRKAYLSSLVARNSHELMRCLEVRNIFDMAEMHIQASLMRKETRHRRVGLFPHYRVDYPETDPAWEKLVVVRKEDSGMTLSTQEIPKLKEE